MTPAPRPRLPAALFYGVIVAGVLAGLGLGAGGVWAAVAGGSARPEGRGAFAGVESLLAVPIAGMAGATFGGLAGLAVAVIWDRRRG